MASFTSTYPQTKTDDMLDAARFVFGGSGGGQSVSANLERKEPFFGGRGSHMPLDTNAHWTWSNPLNVLPALVLLAMLIAIVGTLFA